MLLSLVSFFPLPSFPLSFSSPSPSPSLLPFLSFPPFTPIVDKARKFEFVQKVCASEENIWVRGLCFGGLGREERGEVCAWAGWAVSFRSESATYSVDQGSRARRLAPKLSSRLGACTLRDMGSFSDACVGSAHSASTGTGSPAPLPERRD